MKLIRHVIYHFSPKNYLRFRPRWGFNLTVGSKSYHWCKKHGFQKKHKENDGSSNVPATS